MKLAKAMKTVVFSLMLGLICAGQAVAETTFRYAEGTPNRGTRAEALQFFAEEVKRESGGEMALDIHWGGALLKYSAIMDGVSAGAADLGTVLAPYQPQKLQALAIGDLPLANSDPWVGLHAMYDLMTGNEQMKQALAEHDLVYLGNFTTTSVQFECTEGNEIRTIEDLKGKRMRASVTYAKVLDDLGANMVNMTYSDIYQALDTGLADCNAGYFYAMRAFKTPEVTHSVTRVDWGQIMGFAIVINRYLWDDLTPEQQQVFRSAGKSMTDYYARLLLQEIDEVATALPTGKMGNKVKVIQMAEADRQQLFSATEKYVREWIDQVSQSGLDGQGIWDQYTALLEKYEAERDERGYPWDR
ncbi:C4-dicarboxylate TRAP transporter substrate-binding protein [Marinobacter litoralis]|uniref:C4-dicarboxylate TRAP transporter substrate-binding protein n=1 Tax=Marinobacter litoralis TaxID=187981 RepID=UPI0018ED6D15|nr:C4-dicarboxylate TRAP transporter substrate-binding protein [Marinobacter litoralis]MBJ6136073.1 C4-dicarboxylate TRAP transporter substrate-binding protein [Marinobacter litoralis]